MLNFSEDQGPNLSARMHKRISSLARAADRETSNDLFKFFFTPASKDLSGKADTENPRILLQKILPYRFFSPTERVGCIFKELRIFKKTPKTFYYCLAMRDRWDVAR